MYVQRRRQDFGSGGTSDKISYLNSSRVQYCDGVANISVGWAFSKNVLIKNLRDFEKVWRIGSRIWEINRSFSEMRFKSFKNLRELRAIWKFFDGFERRWILNEFDVFCGLFYPSAWNGLNEWEMWLFWRFVKVLGLF